MRATIDAAGRRVVPKPLRDELGGGERPRRRFSEPSLRLDDAQREIVLQTLAGAGVFGGASFDGLVAL
jgi:hypothetical protein